MADIALADLIPWLSKDQVRERILGRLTGKGFPITDFQDGAIVRSTVEAVSEAIADLVGPLLTKIAAGGYSGEAESEWLRLLAARNYDLSFLGATFTTQRLTLTTAPGTGPYTFGPGDLVGEALSGNRYILDEAGTIPSGGSEELLFKAEGAGSQYADAAGQITRLVTSYPGLSVLNAAPVFSAVFHVGDGTGTVTPSGTPAPARVTIKITGEGQVNAGTFAYSLNGANYISGGVCASSPVPLGSSGISVAFANGGVSPSFKRDDTYLFSSPGSPIVEQGRDEETSDDLAARISGRWPQLSEVPLTEVYEQWARQASGAVRKVTVRPANSAATPGRVDVVIGGLVDLAPVQPAVQAYINARAGITEHPVVVVAHVVEIAAAGEVYVKAVDAARIQVEAQLAWETYIKALPIGGKIYAAELTRILMTAGAINFNDIFVGPVGDANVWIHQLDHDEVADVVAGFSLATLLTWVES